MSFVMVAQIYDGIKMTHFINLDWIKYYVYNGVIIQMYCVVKYLKYHHKSYAYV